MKSIGQRIFVVTFFLFGPLAGSFATKTAMPPGTLEVTVQDENGATVPSAHVYLFGHASQTLFDVQETDGLAHFELPPGRYRVYSATTRHEGPYLDHFASPEAFITIGADENTSVILRMVRAHNPIFYLSEYTRKKIGLDPELAKYLN